MPYSKKIKIILYPMAIAMLIGVFGLLALRWIGDYQLEILKFNITLWEFWFPGILGIVFWLIFLRGRLKFFENPKWSNNQEVWLHGGAIIFIALPILFAQFYIENSQFKKTKIQDVCEMEATNWNACYEITTLEYSKDLIHGDEFARTSGRYNNRLHYETYFLAPITERITEDTILWIGKKYEISFSNRESDAYKDERWRSFYKESFEEFKKMQKAEADYLLPLQLSADLNHYTQAIHRSEENIDRYHRVYEFSQYDLNLFSQRMLYWFLGSVIAGLVFSLLVAIRKVNSERKLDVYLEGNRKLNVEDGETRDFLLLKGDYKVTALFIYLMVTVYIVIAGIDANLFYINGNYLSKFGALKSPELMNGEYWRLISYQFLHGGIMHIVYNAVSFVLFGFLLESVLGHVRFALLFIIGGIIAGIASMMFTQHLSVGASGSIYALGSWFLVASAIYKKQFGNNQGTVALVSAFIVVGLVFGLVMPSVDNGAHFGGIAGGIVLALFIRPLEK